MKFSFEPELLNFLARIFPAKTIIHVGGDRSDLSELREAVQASLILHVEADKGNFERKQDYSHDWPEVQVHQAVLSEKEGVETFYRANLRRQSGLICPEDLVCFWQNLKTISSGNVTVTTLDKFALSAGSAKKGEPINWLIIETLSAMSLLKGAAHILQDLEVVIVKAAFSKLENAASDQLAKDKFDSFLSDFGFREVAQIPEMQPLLQKVFYIKNWGQVLTAQLAEQKKDSMNRIEGLRSDLQEEKNRAALKEQQVTDLTNELNESYAEKNRALDKKTNDLEKLSNLVELYVREIANLENRLNPELSDNELQDQQALSPNEKVARLKAEADKLVSERAALQEELAIQTATSSSHVKQRRLSENNLQELREKYRHLTEQYHKQTDALHGAHAQLLAALHLAEGGDNSEKNRTRK